VVRFSRSTFLVVMAVLMSAFIFACKEGDSVDTGGSEVIVAPPKSDYACNPLSTQTAGSGLTLPTNGLMADLYYLTSDQPRYSSVDDMIAFGHPIDTISLYFDRLFIPTRPFDRGFVNQNGEILKDQNGNTLYEYFALHFESKLRLTEDDAIGAYQFGILADDGAKFHVDDQNTGFYNLVNNDGVHATKFKCATAPVFLDRTSKIPMKLDYHQGPRFHVSLVLLWRPWPDSSLVNDVECNQSGNSRFFDSTQDPPVPKTKYLEMVSRGWMPLQTGNFVLPYEDVNPCQPEDPLALTDINVTDRTQTSAIIHWTTNIAGNSEVLLKRVSNNSAIVVPVDAALVTDHAISISGLTADTLYSFEVVSTTASGQSAKSDPRTFRTFR